MIASNNDIPNPTCEEDNDNNDDDSIPDYPPDFIHRQPGEKKKQRKESSRIPRVDEGDIATRTRSKRRIVGALHTSTIEKLSERYGKELPSLLKIPTMMFFVLLYFLIWIPTTSMLPAPLLNNHGDYRGAITSNSPTFIDQLNYWNFRTCYLYKVSQQFQSYLVV